MLEQKQTLEQKLCCADHLCFAVPTLCENLARVGQVARSIASYGWLSLKADLVPLEKLG